MKRFVLPCLAALMLSSSASSAPLAPSASSSAAPPEPPLLTELLGTDIPAERSKAPTQKEWADAKEYRVKNAYNCKALVLREWLSVSCVNYFGAGLVAGDSKEVTVTTTGVLFGMDPDKPRESHVTAVWPIERGKARLVSFEDTSGPNSNTVDQGPDFGSYGPMMIGEGPVFQVWWREGQASPSIVVTQSAF